MDRRAFLRSVAALAAGSLAWTAASAGEDKVFIGLVPGTGAGGYDVVAYFAEGKAVKGEQELVAEHEGVRYRFASAANRERFVADPEAFLPRFGGYCAWAVANGYTAKGDPEAWSVVDGRLYLNYSKEVRDTWAKDTAGNIAKGEANWPKVLE